jgi:hypothetical protein
MNFLVGTIAVFLTAALVPSSASSTGIDLDGNGSNDQIIFKCEPWSDEFWIKINGAELTGRGDYLEGTYSVVDIDSTDKVREIAIPGIRAQRRLLHYASSLCAL